MCFPHLLLVMHLLDDPCPPRENPLIGWTSTADTLENVGRSALNFFTKEEAVAFCTKHGWECEVDEPAQRSKTRQKRFSGYGDNFRCA